MPTQPHNTNRLAEMLSIDPELHTHWTEDDLGPILEHQLRSPLQPDLIPFGPWPDDLTAKDPIPTTFLDLLHAEKPQLKLLILTKEFAKSCVNNPASSLPKPVATTIYYASIAAGLASHGKSITTLDADAMQEGFTWISKQPWIDPVTKSLALQCLKELK